MATSAGASGAAGSTAAGGGAAGGAMAAWRVPHAAIAARPTRTAAMFERIPWIVA
jgi:hypothetical protein